MKIEFYPVTGEEKEAADTEYRRVADNQKAFLRQIAEKLDNGHDLNALERGFAAAAIRRAAEDIPTERPRPNKRPPKIPGDAAIRIAARVVFDGASKRAAMEELMEQYGLEDDSGIKKALTRQGYMEIKERMEKGKM